MVVHFSTNGLDIDNWLGFFRCFFGFFLGQLVYSAYAARPHYLGVLKASIAEWLILLATIAFVDVARRGAISFAAPVVFACVVYCFAAQTGIISKWLKTRLMQALGNYSYSIYMIHTLIIAATCGALHVIGKLTHRDLMKHVGINYRIAFGPTWMMVGFAMLMLILVVAISSVTYKRIEKPGQRFFSKLARRLPQDGIRLREASENAIPIEVE
jgi:peptidoglycan/LPS O-acetylase OafA/YrhL